MKLNANIVIFLFISSVSFCQTLVDSTHNAKNDSIFIMQKSPWFAVAQSAILPGLGQFYNKSYWKIPVVWGVSGWFIYNYIYTHKKYKDYKLKYEQTPTNSKYRDYRNDYRDQRDQFAIYLGLTYFATLVDAYVDAHLFDFSVEDPLPGTDISLNFRINF